MPVNKNAVTRFKILDGMLSDRHHYYDIYDLTDGVNRKLMEMDRKGISIRAIQLDLKYLEGEPFLTPIVHAKRGGKNAIFYEDQSFSIFKKDLTDDEKNLLNEVLNTIGQFEGLDNFEWLEGLRLKLNSEECSRRIISFSSNPYLKNMNLLGELFTAISCKQVLRLQYKPYKEDMKDVEIYPYLLKQYNNRWFLIGEKVDDGMMGTFALDRIESHQIVNTIKYKECEQDMEERFDDVVGVTVRTDLNKEHIICWVSNDEYPYIETKPLHGSQKLIRNQSEKDLRERYPKFAEGKFISLDCIYNYELRQLLTSYGADLVVLEPMEIREKVKEWSGKLANRYQD